MSKFVRLRPFDRRRGYLLRRYIHRSQKFVESKWYEVPDGLAEELSVVTSRADDEDSPLAFDVFDSKDEALDLVRRERAAKAKATADNPEVVGVLTSADLDEDAAMKAARAKRAEENLERAKAKRANEKEKADRRSKKDKAKKVKPEGGDSPEDAHPVGGDAEADPSKDPFE